MSRYDEILRTVEHPGRYIGQEFGLPGPGHPPPRLRVLLGFPDTYEVGMSHLGFRLLHAQLCMRPDIAVERIFLPWPDLQRALQDEGLALRSLESRSPLEEFDLLGLSVQFELAFPAVLKLLDLAGLPRRAQQRAAQQGPGPLVLVGGGAALNPEPLAPFADFFFLGEADQGLPELVDVLAGLGRGAPREQRLAALASVEGVYIPELVEVARGPQGLCHAVRALPPARLPVRRRYVEDLTALPVPPVHLVPTCELVHDRVTIEIQRGCSQGCRFCQAGFTSRPTRQREPGPVLQAARDLLGSTGYQDLALLSLSAGDHPCLQPMLAALLQEHGPARVAVSLPSMRTETLHPAVAEQISRSRKTTFTLAPEAATDRLRRVINKHNSDQDLLAAVESVVKAGFSRVKLYFMIGLPTETDEEVEAIASLAEQAWERGRRLRRGFNLAVGVSTFVPKPHTPFQWEAAIAPEEVERKLDLLRRRIPRRLTLRWHDPGQSLAEAYLSRGDRRLAAVLERVVDRDHAGLDAWTEHFRWARWRAALQEAHAQGEIPAPETYLAPRPLDSPLPWDHMDVGVERSYLLAQRRAALEEGAFRPDCSNGTCDSCGVCPVEPLHRIAAGCAPSAEVRPAALEPAREGPAREGPAGGEPVAGTPPAARSLDPPRGRGSRPQPDTPRPEKGVFYRLWFHKLGRAALISHLEMAGVFERAARRANLALVFSGGFHPKPRMRFTPALPLGAESTCEFLELWLQQEGAEEPGQVRQRLARQLPPGLELQLVQATDDQLLVRIRGIRWSLHPPAPLDDAALAGARERLAAGGVMIRRKKGAPRDLCSFLTALERGEDGGLVVSCVMGPGGTVKPEEILVHLLGFPPEQLAGARVVRTGWEFAGPGEQ